RGGHPLRAGARFEAGRGRRGRGQLPAGRALRRAGPAEARRDEPDGGTREDAGGSMGQEVRGDAETTALSRDPERSIGAYLARQRELRGFTLDDLAAQTRIPRRSLERLESGVFDRAPDGFVRGFVRTVASALALHPAEGGRG